MRIIYARNVNDAYEHGIDEIRERGERQSSRAGDVLVTPYPVLTVYNQPRERVLFDTGRDANPFFHLVEALWMLRGRDDVEPLQRYVKNFDNFAEGDGSIHGAYGFRWRSALGFDQLNVIVKKLRDNPDDRQCVLQMWDATQYDGGFIGNDDLEGNWSDRPCNTHVYFRVRGERGMVDRGNGDVGDYDDRVLDMTVCCRSNDIVWGAYGANAVHFSFLLEYMAGRVGVGVGRMYQLSNNFHAYTKVLDTLPEPENLRNPAVGEYGKSIQTLPIGDRWDTWDADLLRFWQWHDSLNDERAWCYTMSYDNVWFSDVAENMVRAHYWFKKKDYGRSAIFLKRVTARDWQVAAGTWLGRRFPKGSALDLEYAL